jgi:hypothetical protein
MTLGVRATSSKNFPDFTSQFQVGRQTSWGSWGCIRCFSCDWVLVTAKTTNCFDLAAISAIYCHLSSPLPPPEQPTMPPTNADILQIAIFKVAQNPDLVHLFSQSLLPSPRAKFVPALEKLLAESGSKSHRQDPFSDFVDAAVTLRKSQPEHPSCRLLFGALSTFQSARSYASSIRASLTKRLGLAWSADRRHQFITALPSIQLPMLAAPYPAGGEWWYETRAARDRWYDHLMHGKQPDKRLPRHEFCNVDPGQLQQIVAADESVVVHDPDTGELVMVVLRNFCNDPSVLAWVDAKVIEIVGCKKSARVSKPFFWVFFPTF